MAREVTREHQQNQLDALNQANLDLEEFTYSVSHDLRAPLRSIDGFTRILVEKYLDQLPQEAQHFLMRVRESACEMEKQFDGLLLYSRLTKQPLIRKIVPIRQLAGIVFDKLMMAQTKKVELIVGDLPPCHADEHLLNQLLTQLLSNAIKFSAKKETPCIEIGCNDEGQKKIYYVKDNGVGFDMNYVNKLFKVFQRLHSSPEYEGIGLGLAIVDKIIRRHGGKVWAQSEVSVGTTIYFTLGEDGSDAINSNTAS
ncbi:MAG: two-component sensor histidine kinase [Proteobacteria bacterium]|nr:two-component sensor histidine kinase [Pseudomonadota bacterium]